ncbi:unnamed protein product [Natator depressus]
MDPERSGSAPLPCTLHPAREPGFVPLPFFLQHDSPMSWDLCDPLLAAESPGSWESSLLWDGGSLVIANSSQGQPGTPGGAGSISPQPPLDLSGFPLAEPWDSLLPDAPADAALDFVHPLVMAAAHLDPGVPCLMSRINPAFSPTPPPLDPAGFPLPELWTGPHMDAPPAAAPDPTLPPVAAAFLDPTDRPPTSKTNPAGFIPTPPPLDPAGFPLPELWTGPHMDAPPAAAPDPTLPPVAAACLDPTDGPPTSKTNPDLGEVLAYVSHTLSCHRKGMRVKPLMKRLLKERGVDLLAFSQDGGYQGVVSFLQEVPGIELWNPEKGEKCRVLSCTFKKNIADPLPLLCSTLGSYPNGLRVFSLRKAMWQRHGVNLEEFSQQQGYLNTLDYLTRLCGIRLQGLERGEKCLVQLQKGATVKPPAPQPPPAPPSARRSSSSPPPDAPADRGPTGAPGETPGLAEVLACVRDVLGRFPLGLKVGKLKEALWSERGLDLEELSRQRGCGDALHLLRALPHLWLGDPGKGDACLARLSAGAAVKPAAPQPPPDPAAPLARHGSSPPPNAPAPPLQPADGEPRGAPGEMPGLAEVLACVRDVLGRFPLGLKVGKLKEALRSERGLDLEELSRQRGCGDALHLLRALPHLWLGDPGKGDACLARLSAGAAVKTPAPQPPPDPAAPSARHGSSPPPDAPAPPLQPADGEPRGAPGETPGAAVKPTAPQPPPDSAAPLARHGSSPPPDAPAPPLQPADGEARGAPGETPGLAEVLACVQDVLGRFPLGLKVGKLKEALWSERGLDLEELSRQRGCGDALHLLRALPHLWLGDPGKGDACLARLSADAAVNAPAPPAPSRPAEAGGPGAAGPARQRRGQRWVAKPGAMEALIRGALAPCPFGMRVKSLKKLLAGKHGAKLEAFSQARGYGDVVSFLGDVPGLTLRDPERGNNCIVQLQRGVTEVLTLLKCLLRPYKSGLRLQKVQELLLERHRLDLKRFVSSQGEEDVLGFLQRRLPALQYRQAEKGENCIVWLGTAGRRKALDLCPLTVPALCPAPRGAFSQRTLQCARPHPPPTASPLGCQVLPPTGLCFPACPRAGSPSAPQLSWASWENHQGPTPASSLVTEPTPDHQRLLRPASRGGDPGVQGQACQRPLGPASRGGDPGVQGQACQRPLGPANRGGDPGVQGQACQRPLGPASRGGDPGFRAAYSAAHQHPLPLGRTASTKQRLAQMPDVVRMQGCGVQMLLLPVDPSGPPGGEPGVLPCGSRKKLLPWLGTPTTHLIPLLPLLFLTQLGTPTFQPSPVPLWPRSPQLPP